MSTSDYIAALSLILSGLTLFFTVYSSAKTRRETQSQLNEQARRHQIEFSKLNTPLISIRPKFKIEHCNNRLCVDIQNLHNEIAVQDLIVGLKTEVRLDGKTEKQTDAIRIRKLLPGENIERRFPRLCCDLDCFVANVGERTFRRARSDLSAGGAANIQKLREMGYLKNGQPPVGRMWLKWEYRSAQPDSSESEHEVEYPLYAWEFSDGSKGVFLQLPPDDEDRTQDWTWENTKEKEA